MRRATPINQALAARVREAALAILTAGHTGECVREAARQAGQWADHLVEGFEAAQALPRPLVCRPGCSYCCYNQVQMTPPEAFLIAHQVARHLEPEVQARVRERLAETRRRLTGLTIREAARRRRQFPCPLLEEDRCAVYPVRPLACRAMHSFDLEQCRKEWRQESLSPVQYYAHRDEIVFSISHGLLEGCRLAGCQAQPLPLAEGLWTILAEPDCDRRWAQGEKVFRTGAA